MAFNPDELPENENNPEQKQENWDRTFEDLDHAVDKLGRHIDPGIKETVASFMINGFPTSGSCEGHLEERFGRAIKLSPYISIGEDAPAEIFIGEKEIKAKIADDFGISVEEIRKNKEAFHKYWDYIQENSVPETPELIAVRQKNEGFQREIKSLIDQFYEGDNNLDKKRVNIVKVGLFGNFNVTTAKNHQDTGGKIEEGQIEAEKQELLKEQEEFTAFTAFLKNKYFNEQ
jgi:hypothetical protein